VETLLEVGSVELKMYESHSLNDRACRSWKENIAAKSVNESSTRDA